MGENERLPARFVMALERARAEETPLPVPDMSSPSSSLANFSFIRSKSAPGPVQIVSPRNSWNRPDPPRVDH
jgi:hypothetical protein